jgi:hypothetical protein
MVRWALAASIGVMRVLIEVVVAVSRRGVSPKVVEVVERRKALGWFFVGII